MAEPEGRSLEQAIGGQGLTQRQVGAVLRRAAEIERGDDEWSPAAAPDLVATDVVEAAAVEAGLSRDAVRRALSELAASGGAVPATQEGGRLVARRLVVARRVPGEVDAVRERVERFLRRQVFTQERIFSDGSRWVPRRGVFADLRRAHHDMVGRSRLKGVRRIDLRVVEDRSGGGDHVFVRLDLDVTTVRRRQAGMLVGGATAGVVATGGLVGAIGPEALLLGAPLTGGLAAGGFAGGKVQGRRTMARIEVVLDGLLDRIEHGWTDERRPHRGPRRLPSGPSRRPPSTSRHDAEAGAEDG